MDKAHAILKDVFRHDGFRLLQEQVIERLVVGGENVLCLFPTGGGKSLTYQIPALCFDGVTLVISPLLALMRDQVETLRAHGVFAANLDSTLSADASAAVKMDVLSGKLKLLYVAPERLNNEGFITMMSQVKISLLAVDESHCISQWGASFRPDYLKIARFAEENDVERVLCLTATGTNEVVTDICSSFMIDPAAGVFRTPMYRPNLRLQIEVADTFQDKMKRLVPFLKTRTGPAIVYVTLQKHADDLANALRGLGLEAMVYHAGLPANEREAIQDRFMASDEGIVCATIAFGMGIDKANIRQVVHLYQPKTLENYSQEVGRAGRDGLPSTCLMFLSQPDIPVLEGFCVGDTCRREDLELWMQEVAFRAPAKDGTIDFALYRQAKEFDIRTNVLGLCFAELELEPNLGYIRNTTPFYVNYDITPVGSGMVAMSKEPGEAAAAVRKHWKSVASRKTIDVVEASESSPKTDRVSMAKQISMWEFAGHCTTKVSLVRSRFIITKPFPKTITEMSDLTDILYARMIDREQSALKKVQEVVRFATDDECLANSLATHFDDPDAVPGGLCGHCSFCTTGSAVEFTARPPMLKVDQKKIKAILDAVYARDDPRLLARMAFGITSPRLTDNKWSTYHPLFASMVDTPFNLLVEAFDVHCKKADYENGTPPPKASPAKRSYPSSSSYTRTTSGRGRGSYKRGRY